MSAKSKYLYLNGKAVVNCGSSPAYNMPQGSITVEAWVHSLNTSPYQALVVRRAGRYDSLGENGLRQAYVNFNVHIAVNGDKVNNQFSARVFDRIDWFHVAMTYASGTLRLYKNGEVVLTQNVTGRIDDLGDAPLLFGDCDDRGRVRPFTGHLADVRLWRVERTPEEIKAYMNRRLGGHERGLVGYWPLDEGTGFTAFDRCGTNNGTISSQGGWVELEKECPIGASGGMYASGKHRRVVRVDAKRHALGGKGAMTNFAVHAGQTICIRAERTERWTTAPGQRYTANGYIDAPAGEEIYPQYNHHSYVIGALVGSLDDGKTFFPVGTWLKAPAPCAGNLTLYTWDQSAESSDGFIDAVVDVRSYKPDTASVDEAKANGWESREVKAKEHSFGTRDKDSGEGLNTGITVKPGDILRIVVAADEEWQVGSSSTRCTANGVRFDQDKPEYVQLDGTPYSFVQGSLIGSLDKGETLFAVGTHLEMSVLEAGTLTLYSATNPSSGSKGSLRAYIRVEEYVPAGIAVTPGGPTRPTSTTLGPLALGKIQKGKGIDNEWFEITNLSSFSVPLTNWRLVTWSQKQTVVFGPKHVVPANGTVKFWTTAPAQASATDAALNQSQALFSVDPERALLFNEEAILVSVMPA